MARSSAVRKPVPVMAETQDHTPEECRKITREEKIFIYPSSKVPGHANPGMWIVASPLKPVSRGQLIVWEVVGEIAKLKLQLPDIFEPLQRLNDHTASARIKDDANSGMFFYDAYVNGQLAVGGSSPGVIIDP